MKPQQSIFSHHQCGAVLITSLIFLIMLSMLGITASTTSGLEERMAGNTRNRDLAFQAAEAALKNAKNTTSTWLPGPWNGTNGLSNDYNHSNSADYWNDLTNWPSYQSVAVTGVAASPRYLIEKLPDTGTVEHYRITARAVGGDGKTVVILQTGISYTPPP